MIRSMTKVFLFVAAAMLLACSSVPAQQPVGQSPGDVAARIGDRAVTIRELDEKWKQNDPAQNAEATQMIYDGRRAALDTIIADALLADAAKGSGMSADGYLEAEIAKRVKPVTGPEVASFFQANVSQMQGRPLEAMTPAITRFLTDQRRSEAREAVINDLKKKGPAIRVALEAPRATVAINASNPTVGSATAPVTFVEFSDYQCPFCGRVEPTIRRLRATYGDKIRFVWKDFPLTQIHPMAFKAGEAAHCAGDQGKYWELHDVLFSNQQELQPADLKRHAASLGLNADAFNQCLDSSKYSERVRDGVSEGSDLGVNSTPTIFINGRRLAGAQPYEVFAAIVDEELARKR
jgi:protein-disulfide isomerase